MHPDLIAVLSNLHHEELMQSAQEERFAQIAIATRPTTVLTPWPQKLHRTLHRLRLRRRARRQRLAKRRQPTSWQQELRGLLDD